MHYKAICGRLATRNIEAEENGGKNEYFVLEVGRITLAGSCGSIAGDLYSVRISTGLLVSCGFLHSIRMSVRIVIRKRLLLPSSKFIYIRHLYHILSIRSLFVTTCNISFSNQLLSILYLPSLYDFQCKQGQFV